MIAINNVSYRYRDTVVLKNISTAIPESTSTVLLGPNGAGKSTLFKLLATINKMQDGIITIDGIDYNNNGDKIRRNITYVQQNTSLEMWLTVEDNLKLYCLYFGLPKSLINKRLDYVRTYFELDSFWKKRINQLSGGYRRRIQLAKVLISDSKYILLDEPTVGLDLQMCNRFKEVIKQKIHNGCSVLISTQNIYEAKSLGSRVLIMNKGSLLADTSIDELMKNTSSYNTYIIKTADSSLYDKIDGFEIIDSSTVEVVSDTIDSVMKLINVKTVQEIYIKKKELEDVFLSITKEVSR